MISGSTFESSTGSRLRVMVRLDHLARYPELVHPELVEGRLLKDEFRDPRESTSLSNHERTSEQSLKKSIDRSGIRPLQFQKKAGRRRI